MAEDGPRRPDRSRSMRRTHATSLVFAAAFATLPGAALAQPDRIKDTPAGWSFWYGATAGFIDGEIADGRRPFNITPTGGNYDVILVQNSGEYAAGGADVYWAQSTGSIASALAMNNKRIIDLELVNALTGTFSAVVVNNSGATAAPGWSWSTGLTFQGLVDWQANNGLRPIDVDQYDTAAGTRYSVVAVPNSGNNHQSGWWWLFNVTDGQVTGALTTNSARLIDIDIASTNPLRFNAVMVSENPGGGWWHPGLTPAQVNDFVNQNAARLTCLQRYTNSNGDVVFAVAGVDNANAQTRRIRDLMASETNGFRGAYLRRVNGPTLVALDIARTIEPASMIKILHGAYAVDRCAANQDDLDGNIFIRDRCNNNECPDNSQCNAGNELLRIAIEEMLEQSDNNRTMEIELRYGRTNLNNYAALLGLSSTRINHRLGCGWYDQPRNEFSLEDAGLLYEYITDGTLFNATFEEELREMMNDYSGDSAVLEAMIDQERVGTDMTNAEVAAFKDLVRAMEKGGSYGWPTSSGASTSYQQRTGGGWATFPHKTFLLGTWVTVQREYVLGAYVNDAVTGLPGAQPNPNIAYTAFWELLREPIREALESWDGACTTPAINNEPDDAAVAEGSDVVLSVGLAPGTGSRDFQWQKVDGLTWNDLINFPGQVSGASTANLTLHNVTESDQGRYRCVVTAVCGSDTSAPAIVIVNPPGCDSIDFNGDGLYPDNLDLVDFLSVFGGGACSNDPNCGDVDFNNDGLYPDNEDILSLFRVFGGGAC
jgi:hypothetical protein